MKKLIFLVGMISLTACREGREEPEVEVPAPALINYYFSVKPTTEFDGLSFSFDYTRAFQAASTIRTVYLEPRSISVFPDLNQVIGLGSSTIEPIFIEKYDFGLSRFELTKEGTTLSDFVYGDPDYDAEAAFTPAAGDTLDVWFELDLAASVVLDSAGKNWITPSIKVIRK